MTFIPYVVSNSSVGMIDAGSDSFDDEKLRKIIEAAHNAPLSVYADYLSVIIVIDAAKRTAIANVAGVDSWVADLPVLLCVVIDFNRAAAILRSVEEARYIFETYEGFATACADAGMMLTAIKDACQKMKLGFAMMDSFRFNSQAIADILALPPMTFPWWAVA